MPVNGQSREYTWHDILCLLMKDMSLDHADGRHHDMWYLGNFNEPKEPRTPCIRIVKYDLDYEARIEENAKDKIAHGTSGHKLSEQEVMEIYHDRRSNRTIARTFEISPTTVGQIKHKTRWSWLTHALL